MGALASVLSAKNAFIAPVQEAARSGKLPALATPAASNALRLIGSDLHDPKITKMLARESKSIKRLFAGYSDTVSEKGEHLLTAAAVQSLLTHVGQPAPIVPTNIAWAKVALYLSGMTDSEVQSSPGMAKRESLVSVGPGSKMMFKPSSRQFGATKAAGDPRQRSGRQADAASSGGELAPVNLAQFLTLIVIVTKAALKLPGCSANSPAGDKLHVVLKAIKSHSGSF
jgi:hypothetical protein